MTEENLLSCPLDCGARIKSLHKHLAKCQNKKLLGVKYKLCKYNPSHIIKNELYELHLISCESKKIDEDDDSDEDSIGEYLKKKLNDENVQNNINNGNENIENKEKEEEKKLNSINKRKRRYNHENALFKNESEIDKECLDFYYKVYIE